MSRHNEELGAIFVHVPKAAGSSLSQLSWNRGNGHKTVADFCQLLGPKFKSQFVWAFVRNPFDRIVSAYEDCPEIFPHAPTFEQFIKQIYCHRQELEGLKFLRETAVPRFGFPIGRLHFQPMHLLLSDPDGWLRCHFLGRFEKLAADFYEIQKRLGQKREPLAHKNRRANKPNRRASKWQDLYTPELVEMVAEIYAKDFELFNYPREIKQTTTNPNNGKKTNNRKRRL